MHKDMTKLVDLLTPDVDHRNFIPGVEYFLVMFPHTIPEDIGAMLSGHYIISARPQEDKGVIWITSVDLMLVKLAYNVFVTDKHWNEV